MNQFELFCLVYFALDSVWDNSRNKNLGQFLSDVNPFLLLDVGSADPAMFIEFCEFFPKKEFSIEESYTIANEYINRLDYYYSDSVRDAWKSINQEKWIEAAKKYLSQPHKK